MNFEIFRGHPEMTVLLASSDLEEPAPKRPDILIFDSLHVPRNPGFPGTPVSWWHKGYPTVLNKCEIHRLEGPWALHRKDLFLLVNAQYLQRGHGKPGPVWHKVTGEWIDIQVQPATGSLGSKWASSHWPWKDAPKKATCIQTYRHIDRQTGRRTSTPLLNHPWSYWSAGSGPESWRFCGPLCLKISSQVWPTPNWKISIHMVV